jgi:hypothetical protein
MKPYPAADMPLGKSIPWSFGTRFPSPRNSVLLRNVYRPTRWSRLNDSPLRQAGVLATIVILACPPSIAAPEGNALETFDAFLAASAPANPTYRTDIRRSADPEHVTGGRMSAVSPLIGPFTYRPKTYAELTRSERIEMLRDGRFHDFLIRRSSSFVVSAETMLTPDSIDIRLNPQ